MRLLALVVVLGCSSSAPAPSAPAPVEPAQKPPICTDLRLGGYEGSAECKATADIPIPGTDRACRTNADCIRLGPHCAPFAIRADRTDAYASFPCASPEAGQCPPPCAAVCREGCCAIPTGWGDNCR
jgi:hypothetical protein